MNSISNHLTTSTAAAKPRESSPSLELAKKMVGEKVDASCRDKLIRELSTLPAPLLEKLHQDGLEFLTIQSKREDGTHTGGYFRTLNKNLALDVETFKSEDGRAVLMHEIGHAIDWGRVSAKGLKDKLAMVFFKAGDKRLSENSPELTQAYQQFKGRNLASFASEVRQKVNDTAAPEEAGKLLGKHVSSSMYKNGTFIRQTGDQDDLLVFQHDTHRVRKGLVSLALGAASVGAAVMTGGIAGVVLGASALVNLTHGAVKLSHKEKEWKETVGPVEVKHDEKMTSVRLPKSAQPEQTTWTTKADYLASSDRQEELFAEGVSAYLTSPESRQKLAESEPEVYKVIEKSLQEYFIAP